jgi:DNA processing protein
MSSTVHAALLDDEELAAWLRLLETDGVGRLGARRLLSRFGSPQEVFRATEREWRLAVGDTLAGALARAPAGFEALLDRTRRWLAEDRRRAVLTLGDPAYPIRLLELADPPLLLYAIGVLDWLHVPALAIVGSRHPTPQGLEHAERFAREISNEGWAIVSGLASGVDGAAHRGALEGRCGTVAVVGTGLDQVYPKRHAALAERIAERGVLLSEYPLGAPPLAHHFPQRNRLIAGLGAGTLVVEAALKSGSLITARLAAECGREVFAVPGPIHNPMVRGCHALIKQGAKLVESCEDILDELRPDRVAQAILHGVGDETPAPAADSAPAESPLLQALGYEPTPLDLLVHRTGLSPAELSVALLDLELAGTVQRLPGQIFQRTAGR